MLTRRHTTAALTTLFAVLAVFLYTASAQAQQRRFFEKSRVLQFTPEQDTMERYRLTMTMRGLVSRPFRDPKLYRPQNFWMNSVIEDNISQTGRGTVSHEVELFTYRVNNAGATTGFGPTAGGQRGGGGGLLGGGGGGAGGGGGGGGNSSFNRGSASGESGFREVQSGQQPMQAAGAGGGDGGGGGGTAGEVESIITFSPVEIQNFSYIQDTDGYLLQMDGLESIDEFTKAQLDEERQEDRELDPANIQIDYETFWDWTHMLTFPDRALGAEEIWFGTVPMPVPGLPDPVAVDAEYRLLTYHRFGNRKVAVIDMYATAEFDREWTEENEEAVVDFKAFGTQSVSARFLFDYEKGTIFGIERPPLVSNQLLAEFAGQISGNAAGGFVFSVLPGCMYVNPGEPYDPDEGINIPVSVFPPTACQSVVTTDFGNPDIANFQDLFAMRGLGIKYPGLVVNTQMRYYTNTDYKEDQGSRRILSEQVEENEQDQYLDRRWVSMQFFGQMEAE